MIEKATLGNVGSLENTSFYLAVPMGSLLAPDPSAEGAVLVIIPDFVSKQQETFLSWGYFAILKSKNKQILIFQFGKW